MKICQQINLILSLFAVIFFAGCRQFGTTINDPSRIIEVKAKKAGSCEVVTIPNAQNDPGQAAKAVAKKESDRKEEKKVVEKKAEVREIQIPEKKEEKTKAAPRSPENYRRGPGTWRAFSRLSRHEQEELLKLQRSDPEKFRSVMQEKADQLYAAEKKRQQELDELAIQCNKESDPAKKAELKKQLRLKIHEDFLQRLQDTRRDIESNKRRTEMMEKELQKREKNCEAIVDALLEHRLQNKSLPASGIAKK